jgi:uncharacterized glyoxalase superfamily protein PhnB
MWDRPRTGQTRSDEEHCMGDVRPVLNQINLVARDYAASVAFYRRLGVVLEPHGGPEFDGGIRHAEVTFAGGVTLEFDNEALARTYNAGWRSPRGGSRALLGFAVPSRDAVDALHAEMVAAGYESRQPPYDTFFGARYAVIADPDGNDVGIMSPLDETKRSWPPRESPSA